MRIITSIVSVFILSCVCVAHVGVHFVDPPVPITAVVSFPRHKALAKPSNKDRTLVCPVRFEAKDIPRDYAPSTGNIRSVAVDTATIPRVLPELSAYFNNTMVILIKRDLEGRPYFKYLTANRNNYDEPKETWSSSKIFAAMNGAGKLREDCGAGKASSFDASRSGGLNHFIDGKMGRTPLGDFASVICNYEEQHYTSNALANWFEMVGGRQRMNNIIKGWLDSNTSALSSLGGAYGMPAPSDLLSFKFYPPASGCQINGDTAPHSISNTLSALQMAELTKRIVMARELPSESMPSTTWDDSETLLYGAHPGTSVLFPGEVFGGMASCEFPVNTFGLDLAGIDAASKGKWRAFGKDGFGYSQTRKVEERTFNGYACYPSEAKDKGPVRGVEFIYSTRLSIPGFPNVSNKLVKKAAEMLNKAIIEGRIA